VQFFLLGPYVGAEAIHTLVTGDQPETSWLGIGLVASSVIGMPFPGIAKRRRRRAPLASVRWSARPRKPASVSDVVPTRQIGSERGFPGPNDADAAGALVY
jgi:hypothetical protein